MSTLPNTCQFNFRFYVQADPTSPMKLVHYETDEIAEQKLNEFKDKLFENGIAVARARYLDDVEVFPVKQG